MKLVKVDQMNPAAGVLQMASEFLLQEYPILHPTETVYGLAGLYNSIRAIEQINSIKARSIKQPFSVMVNSVKEMLRISGNDNYRLEKILNRIFPGEVTVLLPRNRELKPSFWNQFSHLGFRMPDHPLCNGIVRETGIPVITTSANPTGQKPAGSLADLSADFLAKIPLILDGGSTFSQIPSTIIELDNEDFSFRLIRQGAVSWDVLEKKIAGG